MGHSGIPAILHPFRQLSACDSQDSCIKGGRIRDCILPPFLRVPGKCFQKQTAIAPPKPLSVEE